MIDKEDIKTFTLIDLIGKTIEIFGTKDEESGMVCIIGLDKNTFEQYMLGMVPVL